MNYKHITINERCCIANFLDLRWSIRKIAKYMNRNVVSSQTMVVNPNYLNEFPIYDSSNNKIEISEDERDWVILVPDIYREKENNIKNTFRKLRRLSFDYEINEFSGEVPKYI